MPVQIDKLETSVEIMPQTAGAARDRDRGTQVSPENSVAPVLRDAVLKVIADEFESFSRMRGH